MWPGSTGACCPCLSAGRARLETIEVRIEQINKINSFQASFYPYMYNNLIYNHCNMKFLNDNNWDRNCIYFLTLSNVVNLL